MAKYISKKYTSSLFPQIKQIDDERIVNGKLIGIVYLVINQLNNKKYIGQTRRLLWKRWLEHLRLPGALKLFRALKKYDESNFKIDIVAKSFNPKELDELEKYWIKYYNTNNDANGYNITEGGLDYVMPFEERIKRSKYYVKCVETGEIFGSLKDAAFSKQLSCGNIYQCVEKRPSCHTVGGYHWKKIEKEGFDTNLLIKDVKITYLRPKYYSVERKKYTKVKNSSTGQEWDKVEDLAQHLGLHKYTYLRKCINKQTPFRGEVYEYIK